MAIWGSEVTTTKGGNVNMKIQGGYVNLWRNGSTVAFNYGVRFTTVSSYTYNSIAAIIGGTPYYAMKSKGGTHSNSGTWLYATSSSSTIKKYTAESADFYYSTTVDGVGGGEITVTVGTAWNNYAASSNKYTYSFKVPYPAASSYSISYSANGGSGAPGGQTKYQGYNLTLQSGTPTKSGYAFSGWLGSDGNWYSAGQTFTGDYNLTLTAQWTPTNPIFSAPNLSANETTISWSAFSVNTNSNIYYQLDSTSGSWTSIGSNTTTGSAGSISGLTPGTIHTVYFKAVNAADSASTTTHSSGVTLYNYPYITGIGRSIIDIGSTQTISLYNPLGRSVIIKAHAKTSTYDSSITTTGTSVNLTIPINMANDISNDTNHNCPITYTSNYSSHTSSISGTINLTAAIGGPTINANKKQSFVEIGDVGTFKIGSTQYNMSNATGSVNSYLQGYSKLKYKLLSANNPFASQYGATIIKYSVKINAKTDTSAILGTQYYEGSSAGTTTSGSAVVMSANNTYTLTISATDSRGFVSSYTYSFSTLPYSKPSLGTPQIVRNDGYGSLTTLTISGSWSPNLTGIHLAKKITLYYSSAIVSLTSYVLYEDTGNSTTYKPLAGNYNLKNLSFDSDKAYNIYIIAEDCFGNTATSKTGSLALGIPTMLIDTEQMALGVNRFPDGKGVYVDGVLDATSTISGKEVKSNGNRAITYYAIDATSLSTEKFYPVIFDENKDTLIDCEIHSPNVSGSNPWNQNSLHFQLMSGGWSDAPRQFTLLQYNVYSYLEITIGSVGCGSRNGHNGFWVRGGLRYRVYSNCPVTLYSEDTTKGSEIFTVGTNYNGGTNTYVDTVFTPVPNATDEVIGWQGGLGVNTHMLAAYPVGALFLSYNATSPAKLFGGTWEKLSGGFLYGTSSSVGTGNGTGTSSESVTLTANQSGLRSHNHDMSNHTHWTDMGVGFNFYVRHGNTAGTATAAAGDYTSVETGVGAWWGNGFATQSYGHSIDRINFWRDIGGTSGGPSSNSTGSAGDWNATAGHSHTIPYIAVHMWRRTA